MAKLARCESNTAEAVLLLRTSIDVGYGQQLVAGQLHHQQRCTNYCPFHLQAVRILLSESVACLTMVCRWRSQFRTDHLFLTIKHVLDKFCDPYFALFQVRPQNRDPSASTDYTSSLQRVDQLLFISAAPLPAGTSLGELAQTLLLLLELFHDFTCQDLPQFFEDNLNDSWVMPPRPAQAPLQGKSLA